jgi:hypothetical protein
MCNSCAIAWEVSQTRAAYAYDIVMSWRYILLRVLRNWDPNTKKTVCVCCVSVIATWVRDRVTRNGRRRWNLPSHPPATCTDTAEPDAEKKRKERGSRRKTPTIPARNGGPTTDRNWPDCNGCVENGRLVRRDLGRLSTRSVKPRDEGRDPTFPWLGCLIAASCRVLKPVQLDTTCWRRPST